MAESWAYEDDAAENDDADTYDHAEASGSADAAPTPTVPKRRRVEADIAAAEQSLQRSDKA